MNEVMELAKTAPQPVLVGAVVYLILAVRRIDSRLDEVAGQVGCPARPKSRKKIVSAIVALGLAALTLSACTVTRKCTKAGNCTTHVSTATNAVPVLREIGKWFK